MTKKIKWPKITFPGSEMVPKVSKWGVLGGVFVLKSGLRILIRAPEVPFSVPAQNAQNDPFFYFLSRTTESTNTYRSWHLDFLAKVANVTGQVCFILSEIAGVKNCTVYNL